MSPVPTSIESSAPSTCGSWNSARRRGRAVSCLAGLAGTAALPGSVGFGSFSAGSTSKRAPSPTPGKRALAPQSGRERDARALRALVYRGDDARELAVLELAFVRGRILGGISSRLGITTARLRGCKAILLREPRDLLFDRRLRDTPQRPAVAVAVIERLEPGTHRRHRGVLETGVERRLDAQPAREHLLAAERPKHKNPHLPQRISV